MKIYKGVCIGAGYFSQFHYEAWARLENLEIVAVCDISIEKAQTICDTYGFAKAYENFEEMLKQEKPDFVDVITPPNTHLEICKIAASNSIHIICQKPLAPTYKESIQLAKIIEESNVRMMVHENFRFQPWHREIKKLLVQNSIGNKLHTINLCMRMGDGWQPDAYMNRQPYFREMEKLLIYETGIHFIDVFRYLGGEITKVYAKLKTLNTNIKGEDFAWVNFDFINGAVGFLDANRYNESTSDNPRFTFGKVLIEGNKGSIRLYEDGRITIQLLGEKEKEHSYKFEKINFAGDCVFNTQKHFIDQLSSGKPFETDVSLYLKNIVVQDKIYESSKLGKEISI
ncbi:putative dehydrogenase [Maribacter vaceletii]|uniref:Putative dehydrogenase n=1 Tax=Maribacter vaceletii TaxID=1206816 RepID=A0A495EC09_9FLAO|nr:Gfo/Idh/MocA family oxidoreductase [Maribacter vaceletii]RKR14412.1 putative dehydrogenase [Maribacter vaceletii]